MIMDSATIKLRKLATLEVTLIVTKEFKLRLWFATLLFRCGARVLGGNCKVIREE